MRSQMNMAIAAALLSLACADRNVQPTEVERATQPISATAANAIAPTERLQWLSPLVTQNGPVPAGDESPDPVVDVCEWRSAACVGQPVAQFSRATGTGGARITSANGAFTVDWSIMSPTLTTRRTYRIRVVIAGSPEGEVFVDVIRGRWALTRFDGSVAPLTAATSIPIRFAILFGAAVSAQIGPSGGSLTLPTRGVAITIPAGMLNATTLVQLTDVAPPANGERRLATAQVRVKLPLETAGASILTGNGRLTLEFPLTREPSPGTFASIRAEIPVLGAHAWYSASAWTRTGVASIDLAGTELQKWLNDGNDELDVTLFPIELNSVSLQPSSAPARFSASSSAASHRSAPIVALPSGGLAEVFDPTCPAAVGLTASDVPCGQRQLRLVANPSQAQRGRRPIILVHGWNLHGYDWTDFYVAQGFVCEPPPSPWVSNTPVCRRHPVYANPRNYPGDVYLGTMLSEVQSAYPENPIYVYDYETHYHWRESGSSFARLIEALIAQNGYEAVAVAAHSMGGLVARQAAIELERQNKPALVLGIAALATPHLGTPMPEKAVLGVLQMKGQRSEGGKSLKMGLLRTESTALLALAGSANPSDLDLGYGFTFKALNNDYGYPHSDGVVPECSAAPDPSVICTTSQWTEAIGHETFVQGVTRMTMPDHDHTELKDGPGGVLQGSNLWKVIEGALTTWIRPVASVTASPSSLTLQPGQTATITAALFDKAQRPVTGRTVYWSVQPAGVATVDANGVVTAVAAGGPVQVLATVDGHSAATSVTVGSFPPNSASITVGAGAGTTGSGTVTWDNARICDISPLGTSGSCFGHFAVNSVVTFVATPAAGSTFAGWTGSCAGQGLTPTCALGMNFAGAAYDPKAKFVIAPPVSALMHLPFDANTNDISGNALNGVGSSLVSAADRQSNPLGAYTFNGVSSEVVVADDSRLRFSSASTFTVSAWVKLRVVNKDQAVLAKYTNQAGSFLYLMSVTASGRPALLAQRQGFPPVGAVSSQSISPGQWHMITGTYDGSTQRIYMDGVLVGQQAYLNGSAVGDATMPLRIGNQRASDAYWLDGALDDVRIYGTALTQTQITKLYQTGQP